MVNKRATLLSIVTYLALSIRLDVTSHSDLLLTNERLSLFWNLIGSYNKLTIMSIVSFPCLLLLYSYIEKRLNEQKWSVTNRKAGLTITIPSFLFALFIVFGYAFVEKNSWSLLLGLKNGQIIKTSFVVCGYYILFRYILSYVYCFLDKHISQKQSVVPSRSTAVKSSPIHCYTRQLNKHPFRTVFLTLLAVCVVNYTISYPAVFMGDTYSHIVQAFPELQNTGSDYLNKSNILSNTVYINQHHCVGYTLLLHACLLLGNALFGSFNVGVFICVLLQSVGLMAAVSYAFTVIMKYGIIGHKQSIIVLAYCLFHPQIINYMCLITKDVFYTEFFVLFAAVFYDIIFIVSVGKRIRKRDVFLLILACVGMIVFRNEGRVILTLIFVFAALAHKQVRNVAIIAAFAVIVFSTLLYGFLFSALKYTPGSKGEMFSVPFQQTARYVAVHADEVTQEERNAIDKVLDYDVLEEVYNPVLSNPVKATYRLNATYDDLLVYFLTWFEMFLKHPGTYIQATFNNYYQFFTLDNVSIYRYSYEWSSRCMDYTNDKIIALGQTFSYPERTSTLRKLVDDFYKVVGVFPPVSLLLTPAVYIWLLIVMLFYGIRKKSYSAITIISPALAVFLVCITGPENGYYGRYSFPLVVMMPFFVFMFIRAVQRDYLVDKIIDDRTVK